MADRAVDLPKPHPDDAEDVVDWLSTARALWARGERADALVWLKRAAEAAAACGQPFRASEIGMYVTAIEEAFGSMPDREEVTPVKGESRPPQDTLVDPDEAFGQLAGEVLRNKLLSVEIDMDGDTLTDGPPAGLLAAGAALGPPMVARVAPPGASPPKPPAPPPPPPPSREVHPAKVIVQVASAPPAAALPAGGSVRPGPSSQPPPASFVPPLATPRGDDGEETTLVTGALRATVTKAVSGSTVPFGASPRASTPAPPPARASSSSAAPRATPSGAPAAAPTFGLPPVPRPAPTPTGEALSAIREAAKPPKPASAPPPAPGSQSSRPPPPVPSSTGSSPPPARAPMPSGGGFGVPSSQRKLASRRPASRTPREPILDPWAEEEVARAKPVPPAPKSGSEEVVVVRARFPSMSDEEDVFTSAAPLPVTLRRHAPPAPPSAAPPAAPPGARSVPPTPPVPVLQSASSQPGRLQTVADVPRKSVPPPAAKAAQATPAEPGGERAAEEPVAPAATPPEPKKAPLPVDGPTRPSAKLDVPRPSSPASAAPPPRRSNAPSPSAEAPAPRRTSPPPAVLAAPKGPRSAKISGAPAPLVPGKVSPSSPPAAALPRAKALSTPAPKASASAPPPAKAQGASAPPAAGAAAPPSAAPSAPPAVKSRPAPPPPAPAPAPAPVPEDDADADLASWSEIEAGPPSEPAFDPSRATLPMVLEIEPRPVDVPSMRATIPMALEVPREIEAYFAARDAAPVLLSGVRLDEVGAFEGMPRAVLEMLAGKAEIVQLAADEEVGGFGGALLLEGSAVLCATIVDAAAHWASPGELLVSRGSLDDGIAVRVVGAGAGAKVAVWPRAIMDDLLGEHVAPGIRARAWGDRLQALAGATMGPFGEIEDEHRRALAEQLAVRHVRPGEIWLEAGAPVPEIALVGAGEVELYGPISEETSETVEPGGLVFADLAVTGGDAPCSVRAGAHGALLLLAGREAAERMSALVPDLADRLRGA